MASQIIPKVLSCPFPKLRNGRIDRFRRLPIALESDVSQLQYLGDASFIALPAVLQVAWGLVLRCYTNSSEICFGYGSFGRGDQLVDANVDLSSKLQICSMELEHDMLLSSLLEQSSLLSKEDERSISQSTGVLFNTALLIQTCSSAISKRELAQMEAQFSITVNINIIESALDVFLGYALSEVSDLQATSIAATFNQAISQIQTNYNSPVGQLDLISSFDRENIWERNRQAVPSTNHCVHHLIQDRSLNRPKAQAVCAWDGNFTYEELDDFSSRLAGNLVTKFGVGPEIFVPLYFEKSKWTIVAMLAVMKARGAFVLLDSMQPLCYLQCICKEVGAEFVLSSSENAARSAEVAPHVFVVNDASIEADFVVPSHEKYSFWRAQAANPNDALYAVFTSGSTGTPKGVVIEHAAYSSSLVAHSKKFGLNEMSRVAQFASYAFDASILETLSTLAIGGCVCVLSEAQRKERFAEGVSALRSNFAYLTPSFARLLDPADFPSIQTLVLIGEKVSKAEVSTWASYVHLINGYGPAECAAISTVQPNINLDSDQSNIGYSTGATVWIVDPGNHHRLMPFGAVGELVIEGPIVGRRYINHPLKSAEVFVDVPAWANTFRKGIRDKVRLYKTGDLVRYAEDWSLRYIGRKDTQVKLHGQRIELGEVENHVRANFYGVKDVIAEIVGGPEQDSAPRLVAFVLLEGQDKKVDGGLFLHPSDSFNMAAAKAAGTLKEKVPAYMVPAKFVSLRFIPRTRTGKADRRNLRELARTVSLVYSSSEKRLPSIPVEHVLQQLWSQALGVEIGKIGIDDNFFDLGGDSIIALSLAGLARKLGLGITIADLFNNPTISELAVICKSLSHEKDSLMIEYKPFSLLDNTTVERILQRSIALHPSLDRDNIQDILPTTLYQHIVLTTLVKPSSVLLGMRGPMDHHRLLEACRGVVHHYPHLRAAYLVHNGRFFQLVLRNLDISFEHIASSLDFDTFAGFIDPQKSGSVEQGVPPLQFKLVTQSETEHILILQTSHSQFDGISLQETLKDIIRVYHGFQIPPSLIYTDFLHHLFTRDRTTSYRFWREYLQDSSLVRISSPELSDKILEDEMKIPFDPPKWNVKTVPMPTLPAGFTMATFINAIYSLTLSQLAGLNDLVFFQLANGRSLPLQGIEDTRGFCLNPVPIRVVIQPFWTGLDFLRHIRQQKNQTVPHDFLSWDDIAENCTNWPKDTSVGPVILYQNIALEPQFSMGDFECRMREIHFINTANEIACYVVPGDGFLICSALSASKELSQEDIDIIGDQFVSNLQSLSQNLECALPDPIISMEYLSERIQLGNGNISHKTKKLGCCITYCSHEVEC